VYHLQFPGEYLYRKCAVVIPPPAHPPFTFTIPLEFQMMNYERFLSQVRTVTAIQKYFLVFHNFCTSAAAFTLLPLTCTVAHFALYMFMTFALHGIYGWVVGAVISTM